MKHPNVGHRLQCLQCGNLGHTLGRCSFTAEQLEGPGGIVVTEGNVRELEDLAKPFSSVKELKHGDAATPAPAEGLMGGSASLYSI